MKRRVHNFPADGLYGQGIEERMNSTLAPSERIVAVHYIDSRWYVFTEDIGLGRPATWSKP